MLDKILEFGTIFDWISPLMAGVQDLVHGPAYTLLIPHDCGRSGRSIAGTLRQHGIKTWGHMIVSGTLMITVRKQQAGWAQYLLEREGIPFQNNRIANSGAPPERPKRAPERSSDLLDELASLFDL